MFDLYLITDALSDAELEARTAAALQAAQPGRVAVQLRAKARPPRDLLGIGRRLRRLTSEAGAELFVNAHVQLARRLDADGVHLPDEGPQVALVRDRNAHDLRTGRSCHDLEGVRRAATEGAGFITLSPFAASPGKASPLGAERFARIVSGSTLPVFALGGIDTGNATAAIRAGASGVAVIRAVYAAPDPAAAVAELLERLDRESAPSS